MPAQVDVGDFPLPVDQEGRRDAARLKLGTDTVQWVAVHGMFPGHFLLLHKRLDGRPRVIEAVAHNFEPAFVVLPVQVTKSREVGQARSTVGRPEIDQHHLPSQPGESEGLPVETGHIDLWGGLPQHLQASLPIFDNLGRLKVEGKDPQEGVVDLAEPIGFPRQLRPGRQRPRDLERREGHLHAVSPHQRGVGRQGFAQISLAGCPQAGDPQCRPPHLRIEIGTGQQSLGKLHRQLLLLGGHRQVEHLGPGVVGVVRLGMASDVVDQFAERGLLLPLQQLPQ